MMITTTTMLMLHRWIIWSPRFFSRLVFCCKWGMAMFVGLFWGNLDGRSGVRAGDFFLSSFQ